MKSIASWRNFFCGMVSILSTTVAAANLPEPVLPDWMQSTNVGEQIRHNGIDMRIAYFQSERAPEAILDHFRKEWRKDDIAPVENELGAWRVLGFMEGSHYYTLQVRKTTSGYKSEGMVAVTAVPSEKPNIESSLPRLPGSVLLSVTESIDSGIPAQTVVIENESSVQSNVEFYLSQMRHEGWAVQKNLPGDERLQGGSRVVFFTRDNIICQLSVLPVHSGTTHVVATISTSYSK